MALSSSLQTIVDAKIDDLVTQLGTIQSTYLETNGHYWQGIVCTATIPSDGNSVAVDVTKKPTDQAEDWSNVNGTNNGVLLDATLPVALQVNSYDGPLGKGYVIIATVTEGITTYRRCVNVGSEPSRERNWLELAE